ncbi:MAG: hypothetical protein ACXAD7_29120 [Candidatus Kariarchaeaceae archaeon]|jgi:cytochrome c biogenesis factor
MLDAIGQYSLYFAIIITLVLFINQWKFNGKKTRIESYSLELNIVAMGLLWLSYLALIMAFVQKDYRFEIVHLYSDDSMSTLELIMAAWAQRQGVMILWSAITTTIVVLVYRYLMEEKENPIVKRTLTILLFFSALIAIFAASPRDPTAFQLHTDATGKEVDPGFGWGLTNSSTNCISLVFHVSCSLCHWSSNFV